MSGTTLGGMQGMGSNGTGIGGPSQQIPPGLLQLLMQMHQGQGGMMQGGQPPQPGAPPQGPPMGQGAPPGAMGAPPMGGQGMPPGGMRPTAQAPQQPPNMMQQMGGLPGLLAMLQKGGQTGLQPQMPGGAGGMPQQGAGAQGMQNLPPGLMQMLMAHGGLTGMGQGQQ
jgi:hypothetical protein